jgi:hypothetical protein
MQTYRTVSLSELTPGSVLVTPVFDQRLTKLLHAGAKVDEQTINDLRQRGITEVQVGSSVEKIVAANEEVLSEETQVTQSLQRCSRCQSVIDIRPPRPDQRATIWCCKQCGSMYFGSDEQETELRGLTRADCNTVAPDVGVVTPPILPESAQRLAKSLLPEDDKWADHRRHKRYRTAVPVVVLPLASDFRVSGEAEPMTAANVSLGGAALLHTRRVDAPYLAIDFRPAVDELQVVFKVLRCRPLAPVYEIGGQFISRMT